MSTDNFLPQLCDKADCFNGLDEISDTGLNKFPVKMTRTFNL